MPLIRHALVLILLASLVPAAAGQAPASSVPAPPASAPAAEPEGEAAVETLREEFRLLYDSLRNSGGIADSDHPAILALLVRVRSAQEQWPRHPGPIAMELQLLTWLGETDELGAVYERLMELDPENVQIGQAWVRDARRVAAGDETRRLEVFRQMFERYPDDPQVRTEWAQQLKLEARYPEAIGILSEETLDTVEAANTAYTLAECLFAEHRFQEALDTLDAISAAALARNRSLANQIDTLQQMAQTQVGLWEAEQLIREAEAEAGDLPLVEIHTSRGRILVELFENEAPNTVASFISLAESGFYVGTRFHRFEQDFMIQGGDPNTLPEATGKPGEGNPGYLIPDEHGGPEQRRHFRDSVAMAKRLAPNSAGSQFYLNHRPTPWLDGKHTVFGRVVDGLEVARSLRRDDEITMTVVLRKRDHEYEPDTLPVPDKTPAG